jgi:hypothetical protein
MANGGPDSGDTFTAPGTITSPICDGSTAVYKVTAQGVNYSITCQTRNVINPILTKIYIVAESKPTTDGYYAFCVTPTDGLPTGIALNDICKLTGGKWSLYQSYANAVTALVAGPTLDTQVTWRKFNGRWMSTADEYNPDGKEYQTGKLFNGKPVYRVCISSTTTSIVNSSKTLAPEVTVPLTGTVLLVLATIKDAVLNITTVGRMPDLIFRVNSTGKIVNDVSNNSDFCNSPCMVWVEYTKS